MLTTNENSKILEQSIQLIMVVYALLSLVIGGRTEGIAILIIIVLYNLINNNTVDLTTILKVVTILFVLAMLISTLTEFRNKENKTINNFIETIQDNSLNKNPLVETIGEMGNSGQTIIMTMHLVPDSVNYKKGETYLATLSRLVPSAIDPSGIVKRAHQKSTEASRFLTEYYNLSFGTDTTLIAESYYNFGYYGLIAIMFVGFIVGKILGYSSNAHLVSNNLLFYIKLISTYTLFTLPRRSFSFLVGEMLYSVIFVFILIIIAKKIKYK